MPCSSTVIDKNAVLLRQRSIHHHAARISAPPAGRLGRFGVCRGLSERSQVQTVATYAGLRTKKVLVGHGFVLWGSNRFGLNRRCTWITREKRQRTIRVEIRLAVALERLGARHREFVPRQFAVTTRAHTDDIAWLQGESWCLRATDDVMALEPFGAERERVHEATVTDPTAIPIAGINGATERVPCAIEGAITRKARFEPGRRLRKGSMHQATA
jgi:hypothetical protein